MYLTTLNPYQVEYTPGLRPFASSVPRLRVICRPVPEKGNLTEVLVIDFPRGKIVSVRYEIKETKILTSGKCHV